MTANAWLDGIRITEPTTRTGRLNRRLLLWLLIFSLLPLLATNAIGYARSRAIIERLVERYLVALASVEAQHVGDRIDHHLLTLEGIASGNEFLAAAALRADGRPAGQMGTVASAAAVERFLQHKKEELGAFQSLYLFTVNGHLVAAAGETGGNVTTPPRNSRASSLTVEPAPVSTSSYEPQFRLVTPVLNPAGTPVGFLGGIVGVAGFAHFLDLPTMAAGRVEGFIVDAGGRVLFASRTTSTPDYSTPSANPLLTHLDGDFAKYADGHGVSTLGTIASVPGHPWRFIAQVPEADAFDELRRLGGLSIALEVLLGLILTVLAWIVARGMVAPVHRLVDATRRVGRGDLKVRVDANERDELGELSHAFNEMTSALATTTERVHELHHREIERASQLATVGELAAGIAHEIKNPVVGVSNGLDMVRRRVGNDPTLIPIIDEMSRQCARVQGTLQELLSFARPATPTLGPVSGNQIAERAISLSRSAAARAGIHLDVAFDPNLPSAQADEDMLHQAVVNVLMNAIQATPRDGHILVTTRTAGNEIEISIADTGSGIPATSIDDVFRPFFTTRHTGTGLGLPITREILQRHGGGVRLESKVGVGTTVVLHLPIQPTFTPTPTPELLGAA